MRLSPFTRDLAEARLWLEGSGAALDGVIAKRLDGVYQPGERAMLKVKKRRTADCVVGGFRYERNSRVVGSLLLGLYNNQGKLDHVGFTATLRDLDREALTEQLEALIMPPGFTGGAPGGPSRWSTERSGEWQPLRPELVVEVRYDHVQRRSVPPWNPSLALAGRQGAAAMHLRADRGPAESYGSRADGSGRGRRSSPIAT